MGDKVGIGVIGCGVIARAHIRRYLNSPKAKIVAVCDIVEEKAVEAAELAKAEAWYTDYNEMLERDDIQGVSVCTPHPLHPAPSIAAANAGKHILCEKPMCTKVKDANAMVEAVRRNNVKFLVGYQTRFGTGMQTAKKLIDEALKLTPAARIKLVDEILDSLDETDDSIDLLWAREVEDRIRAYRRGELKTVDLDELLGKPGTE